MAVGIGVVAERRTRRAGDRLGLILAMTGFGLGVVALAPAVLLILGGLAIGLID